MKRLIQGIGKNSSQEYDRIFEERAKRKPDWFDMRRWKYLLKYYKGGSLLDIGCLDSQIWRIRKKGYYLGIDLAAKAIDEMVKVGKDITFRDGFIAKTDFEVRDLNKTGLRDNDFDYAIMGELIEHLEEPQKAIGEAFRILKPGGILAISTPYNEAIEPGAVDFKRHIWSFDKQDIKDLCEPYGKILKIKILGSRWFPYKYAFPTMVAFIQKNG